MFAGGCSARKATAELCGVLRRSAAGYDNKCSAVQTACGALLDEVASTGRCSKAHVKDVRLLQFIQVTPSGCMGRIRGYSAQRMMLSPLLKLVTESGPFLFLSRILEPEAAN